MKKFINLITTIVAVVCAVSEISEENSGYILEKTSHPHLRQIHVERRDGLLNVLKEEDFSGGLKLIEGSTGSAEKRDISTGEHARRSSRVNRVKTVLVRWIREADRFLTEIQRLKEVLFRVCIKMLSHVGADHRTVEGDEISIHLKNRQNVCDVAVPDKNLGICTDHIEIKKLHNLRASVSATRAEDGVHLRVCEHRVDVISALLCFASEIVVEVGELCELSSNLNVISHRLKKGDTVF